MANIPVDEIPNMSLEMERFETKTPVHADEMNKRHKQHLDNEKALAYPEFDDGGTVSEISSFTEFLDTVKSKIRIFDFFKNFKAGMQFVLHAGMIVNNAVTDNSGLPVSAAVAKALQDQLTQLNSDKAAASHTHDERYYTESETDTKLATKAQTSHASTGTTYGVGNASNYGHVKVSDNYTSSAGAASAGVTASSLAVYNAYNTLSEYSDIDVTANINTTYVTKLTSTSARYLKLGKLIIVSLYDFNIKPTTAAVSGSVSVLTGLPTCRRAVTRLHIEGSNLVRLQVYGTVLNLHYCSVGTTASINDFFVYVTT